MRSCAKLKQNGNKKCGYNAGEWLPLLLPLGWYVQVAPVITRIEENFFPQYLQVYDDFSVPSYNLWRPLLGPSGWRGHVAEVNRRTSGNLCPQYSQ